VVVVAVCVGLPFDEVGWEQLLIGCFVSDSYVIWKRAYRKSEQAGAFN
jgi:hypothetical protein